MDDQQSSNPQPSGQIRPSYCMINSSKQMVTLNPKQHSKIIDNIKAQNQKKTNELNSIYCPHSIPSSLAFNSHTLNFRRSSKPEFSLQHFSLPIKKEDKLDSPTLKQKQRRSKQQSRDSSNTSSQICLEKKLLQTVLGKSQSSQLFELKNNNPENPQGYQTKMGRLTYKKQNSGVIKGEQITTSSENQQKNSEIMDEKQEKEQQIIVKKQMNDSSSQQQQNPIKFKNEKRESLSMFSSSGIFRKGNLNTVLREGQETELIPNSSSKVFPIVGLKSSLLMKTATPMSSIFKLPNSSFSQKSPKIFNFLGDSATFASQQLSPTHNISHENVFSFPSPKLMGQTSPFDFPHSLNSNFAGLSSDQIKASFMNTAPKDSILFQDPTIESRELWKMKLEELQNEKDELVQIIMKEREIKDFAMKQLYELISTKSILPTSGTAKQLFQSLIEMNEKLKKTSLKGAIDQSFLNAHSQTLIGENSTQQSELNQSIISGNQKGSSPQNCHCNNSNLSEQTTFRISLKRSSLPCSPHRKTLFNPTKEGAKIINGIGKSDNYLFSSISPLNQNTQTNNTSLTLNQSGFGGNPIFSNNLAIDQIGEHFNQNHSQISILTNPEKFEKLSTVWNDSVSLFESLNQIKERITKALLLQKRQKQS